eukprot:m.889753 g.889753  ORF g.889753 m.889753 type:complete len:863 (+) comp23646_c0_seq16:232-2820(+)
MMEAAWNTSCSTSTSARTASTDAATSHSTLHTSENLDTIQGIETSDTSHTSSAQQPTVSSVSIEDDEAYARSLAESINNPKALNFGGAGAYWDTGSTRRSRSNQKFVHAEQISQEQAETRPTVESTSKNGLSTLHQELLSLQMANGRRAKRQCRGLGSKSHNSVHDLFAAASSTAIHEQMSSLSAIASSSGAAAGVVVWKGLAADSVDVQDTMLDGRIAADAEWFDGVVIDVKSSAVLFHFNGFTSDEDVWIPLGHCTSRLRLPFHHVDDVNTEADPDPPTSKRGRGRPRKTTPPPVAPTDVAMTTCMCRGRDLFAEAGRKRHDASDAVELQCDTCDARHHAACVGVTRSIASTWSRLNTRYRCPRCAPPFGKPIRSHGRAAASTIPSSKTSSRSDSGGIVQNGHAAVGDDRRNSSTQSRKQSGTDNSSGHSARSQGPSRDKQKSNRGKQRSNRDQQGSNRDKQKSNRDEQGSSKDKTKQAVAPAARQTGERESCTSTETTPHRMDADTNAGAASVTHNSDTTAYSGSKTTTSPTAGATQIPVDAARGKSKVGKRRGGKFPPCGFCGKVFASAAATKFHLAEHRDEDAVFDKLVKAGSVAVGGGGGSAGAYERAMNPKSINRRLVVVAVPLAIRYGAGVTFKLGSGRQTDCLEIKTLLESLPIVSGRGDGSDAMARLPFVYTNVKPAPGGVEGRAYALNQRALASFLDQPQVLSVLNQAGAAGLGQLNVDFRIDSVHHLVQTHSSWFERHIDTHSKGSIDFALICLLDVENIPNDKATGCGVELYPWIHVHEESMNLISDGSVGNTIVLKMEHPGDCSAFCGRWIYHKSVHTDAVGIRGVLHKVVFFGYYLQSVTVPVTSLV